MAAATLEIPSWFKWMAGLAVVAAGVGAAVVVGQGLALEDPWSSGEDAFEPEAITFEVTQGDEDDDAWYVTSYLYEGVDAHGNEYNGRLGDADAFEDKEDAVRKARELGKAARATGHFKLVRVIATKKDWRAAEKRRARNRRGEA